MALERIAHNQLHHWQVQIDEAATVRDVVAEVQDFIAGLTPSDISHLPDDCRPGRIRDQGDIDFWNLRLAEACRALWGTNEDGEILTEVAQVFLRASVRVSRLAEGQLLPRP